MAAFNRFNSYVTDMGLAKIDHSTHSHMVMLVNTAPTASNTTYSSISANEVANGNGYTTGGNAASFTSWANGGTATTTLKLGSPSTWTAGPSAMGAFRYVVLYDNNGTKPLIGWWDYGSTVNLANGETFTATFDGTNGVVQIVSP